jgi:hypothetical protein
MKTMSGYNLPKIISSIFQPVFGYANKWTDRFLFGQPALAVPAYMVANKPGKVGWTVTVS